jgi:starch-binding outer membrane protein, SusD/RagB family
MLHKKLYFIMTVATLAACLPGCKKLDLAPQDRFTELTFWQSDVNVNNALNNIYGGLYYSSAVFYNESMSDNAYSKLDGVNASATIASGNFTPSLPRFQNEWAYYYGGIKSCNIFLENVDKNTSLSDAVKNRMKGEARFVRAWHHFNLMKWWGAVPLLKKDITGDEAKTIARSPKADVLAFVLAELDAAAAALPTKEQYAAADNGRITKGAALALKARALLYEGNRMSEVVAICEQFINGNTNGSYNLTANYSDLFSDKDVNKVNSESMLSLQYVPNLRTWGEYIDFAPISAGARTNNLAPSQELVDAYIMTNGKAINEAGSGYDENDLAVNRDPRLTATIVYHKYNWTNPNNTVQVIYIKPGSTVAPASASNEYSTAGQGTATGYYWRKYFDPNAAAGLNAGTNIHLIRYAEILLAYAEAKQSLGQMDAAIWDKTIKVIRQRAGFTSAGALNFPAAGSNLTNIIRNERRCELAMEGIRIDDIRRWRTAETVLNGWLHGARYGDLAIDNGYLRIQLRNFNPAKHYLWPVPPSEIALNGNLTQNPNY